MTEDDEPDMDIRIDLPYVFVEFSMPAPPGLPGLSVEYEFELAEVLETEGDVEVLETTDTGLVIEHPDGETEHVDLRELEDELNTDPHV